jgi:hypothetical protein
MHKPSAPAPTRHPLFDIAAGFPIDPAYRDVGPPGTPQGAALMQEQAVGSSRMTNGPVIGAGFVCAFGVQQHAAFRHSSPQLQCFA